MELLEKLCSVNAVSAHEEDLAVLIQNELAGYVDEIKTDCLGNIIANKKGNGKKIMITARMDEAGGLVTFVEDGGKIRFNFAGEYELLQALNMTAVFKNGKKGIICADDGKSLPDVKASDMYVDMGDNYSDIGIGDVFSICAESILTENAVMAKSAGERSGVYALICAVKELENADNDIYAVFTARSKVGFKGAKTAAQDIEPDIAICIGDTAEKNSIKCGCGIVFNLKSANSISDKEISDKAACIAEENNIGYVCDVSKDDLSECALIKKAGGGVKTFGVSIPVKYKNAPRQSVLRKDITAMTEFIVKILSSL